MESNRPTDGLQRQYEDLRQQSLASQVSHRGLGWALLVRQGMAAWMQAVQEQVAGPAEPVAVSGEATPAIPQSDLILALVALVLGNRTEVVHA